MHGTVGMLARMEEKYLTPNKRGNTLPAVLFGRYTVAILIIETKNSTPAECIGIKRNSELPLTLWIVVPSVRESLHGSYP